MGAPSVTFTRPADTPTYGAADGIGSASGCVQVFDAAVSSGGMARILSGRLKIGLAAVPSGMASGIRQHLYTAEPAALADAATWVMTADADKAGYIGYIDYFPAVVGGHLVYRATGVDLDFKAPPGETRLWSVLTATAGWVCVASTVYENTLFILPL